METLNKRDLFFLGLILLAGLLLRSVPLLLPYYTTDQTGIALQAWNIIQGEWPIFYYGQAFQGSLEGYLCSLFFRLVEPNWDLGMGLLCLFASLLFMIFFYLMVKEIFNKKLALISLLLIAVAPPYLMQWGHDPRLHYSFIMVFQALIFWLTAKLLKQPFNTIPKSKFFILGLIGGLAWWTNFLNVHTLLAAGIFLLIKEPITLLKRHTLPGLIGFVIGSLPVWIFNATNEFISFQGSKFAGLSGLIKYVPVYFSDGIAYAYGLYHNFGSQSYTPLLYLGMGLIYIAIVYFCLFEKSSFFKGRGLLIGYVLSSIFITCTSVFAKGIGDGGQYLIGIIPILAIAIASFSLYLNNKTKVIGTLVLLFFLGNSLFQNIHHELRNMVFFNSGQADWVHRYNHSNKILFETLRKKEITGAYKDEDEIYKLKYLGEQEIFFSDFYQDNYPPDAEQVDGSEKIAFVLRKNLPGIKESLKAMKVDYQTSQIPDYLLFTDFDLKTNQWKMLNRTNWKATSSINANKAALAFDGKGSTRWSSDRPKEKGIFFQLDLGQPQTFSRISIHPGNWSDYPSGLSVKVSNDQTNWTEVLSYPFTFGPFFWEGTHPFYRVRRPRVDLHFDPVKARYIHFTHLNPSKRYFWSIMELYVYNGIGKIENNEFVQAADTIIKRLQQNDIEFVAADHWLSARIKANLKNKIKTYPSNLFTGINRQEKPHIHQREPLKLSNKTAFIVTEDKIQETEPLLKGHYQKEVIGPYIIYSSFKDDKPQPLYWAGDHLLHY